MKIAVACDRPEPTALVVPRFGRADWFLIYDTVSKRFATLSHRKRPSAACEIGIQSARLLIRARIGAVVAGEFGDSARRILHDAHICLLRAGPVTAALAISEFQHGRLVDL
ncbi:MAG: NifB/NifX family molybdenum-iron cluster-binding protein [Verrucomicrobiota bacterium]